MIGKNNCYLVEIRNIGKSNASLGEQIRILNVSSEVIPLRDLKNASITKEGNWAIEEDFSAFLGQAIVSHARGDKIAFKMAGQRLKIDFACTQFGGKTEIRINGNLLVKTVDLFSPEWTVLPVSIKMERGHERLLLKEDQMEHKDQQLQKKEFGRTGHLTYEEPSHLSSIFLAPAEQLLPERLLLYSLVFGLRPKHCLEIGTHWGGSALIICAAMDDVGSGHLVCIDPNPQIAPEIWEHLKHRTDLIQGLSPDALPQALELSGSPFDFALIDGDHSYKGVLKDIEGVMPCLADGAYLLFHDCLYFEIEEAINEALRRYPGQLHDSGILSVEAAPENIEVDGRPVLWGGLRLLLFTRGRKQIEPLPKQLQAIQEELWITRQRLQAIETSLTWQIGQKLAYSWPGRALHYLISHLRR